MKKLIPILIFTLLSCSSAYPKTSLFALMPQSHKGTQFMNIDILGSLSLNFNSKFGPVSELSGIAWDEDENLLYAVTDEGLLHHFKLKINNKKQLLDVLLVDSFELKNQYKKALKGIESDAEGLDLTASSNGIKGDSQLIISFEREPRIDRYSSKGRYLGGVNIPAELKNKKHYSSPNKGLESVSIHPKFGVLTSSELPLHKKNYQTLYAADGKYWRFNTSVAANSSITGSEVLPNGNVLLLERSWSGLLAPVVISLRELEVSTCKVNSFCPIRDIAIFSSAEGWLLDNFEGLTHIKDNHYLMVSDDNQNPFQSTVMVLFKYL